MNGMNLLDALGVGGYLPNYLIFSHCNLSVILPIVSLVVWSLFIKKLAGVGKLFKYSLFYGGEYECHGSKIDTWG